MGALEVIIGAGGTPEVIRVGLGALEVMIGTGGTAGTRDCAEDAWVTVFGVFNDPERTHLSLFNGIDSKLKSGWYCHERYL